MSTIGITPLTITGVSSMSTELQTVLNRAVSIASLPLKQLQNQDADILSKKTLLAGLGETAATLGDAVAKLGQIASGKSLAATSSDSGKVSVQNTGAESATVYTISDVQSIAAAASATSIGFSSASGTSVSKDGTMRFKFGDDGKTYDFTLTDKSIGGLRDKINSLGAGVTATILTAGDKNYLSISANSTGAVKNFSLIDNPQGTPSELLSSPNLGTNAVFKLNGVDITRTTNAVNDVISGLTFTLLDKPSASVKLTLATDKSQLSGGISSFVSAYNAMADKIQGQVGPGAGLLSGAFAVREIQEDMRSLAGYQADGAVKSLWEMGLEFDSTGKLSFDTTRFNSLPDSQVAGALAFFGSETSGFGALAKKFTAFTDPISGTLQLEQDGLTQTDKNLQTQITTLEERVSALQQDVASRLQIADSLLAGLESQQKMLTATVDSLNYVLYGKKVQD